MSVASLQRVVKVRASGLNPGQSSWECGLCCSAEMMDSGGSERELPSLLLLRPWGHVDWSQQGFGPYEVITSPFFSLLLYYCGIGCCVWTTLLCPQTGFRHSLHGDVTVGRPQTKTSSRRPYCLPGVGLSDRGSYYSIIIVIILFWQALFPGMVLTSTADW